MDLRNLMQEPSGQVRGMLAAKIAEDYRQGSFTQTEAEIADDIFRILLKDVEKVVRKNLAEQLCHCPNVPKDIVMKLAQDEADIAVPMLEYSQVLADDDLIAIVKSTREVLKLCAIARRDHLSQALSGVLMETQNQLVMTGLFKNRGSDLGEESLIRSWNYIASSTSLLEALVGRGGLPLTVVDKIFAIATDSMKQRLIKQYKISSPMAIKASNDAREWEMLGLIPGDTGLDLSNDERVEELVDQLHATGRLTHSLLIRALCTGNLGVFEAGIAALAGVPRVNARLLLTDSGTLGFHAIYKVAAMPAGFAEAVRVLLDISLEETDFGTQRDSNFRKRVIERIYVAGYHKTVENMEYLLSIIGGRIDAAKLH